MLINETTLLIILNMSMIITVISFMITGVTMLITDTSLWSQGCLNILDNYRRNSADHWYNLLGSRDVLDYHSYILGDHICGSLMQPYDHRDTHDYHWCNNADIWYNPFDHRDNHDYHSYFPDDHSLHLRIVWLYLLIWRIYFAHAQISLLSLSKIG